MEIEEVDFDEIGMMGDVAGAHAGLSGGVDAHGVDAGGREQFLFGEEIGGGKSEGASELFAAADGAGEAAGAAEHCPGGGKISAKDGMADAGAGNSFVLPAGFGADVDLDVLLFGKRTEEMDVAAAAAAETPVGADDDADEARNSAENFLKEVLRLLPGPVGIEGQAEMEVGAEVPEDFLDLFFGAEEGGGFLRAEHAEGMGMKAEDARAGGLVAGMGDDIGMTEVQAVEGTNRECRRFVGTGEILKLMYQERGHSQLSRSGCRRAVMVSRSMSRRASTVKASSTENVPERVRRRELRWAPQPRASPRSWARVRT